MQLCTPVVCRCCNLHRWAAQCPWHAVCRSRADSCCHTANSPCTLGEQLPLRSGIMQSALQIVICQNNCACLRESTWWPCKICGKASAVQASDVAAACCEVASRGHCEASPQLGAAMTSATVKQAPAVARSAQAAAPGMQQAVFGDDSTRPMQCRSQAALSFRSASHTQVQSSSLSSAWARSA